MYAVTRLANRSPEAVELLGKLTAEFEGASYLKERIEAQLIIAAWFTAEHYRIARELWDVVRARDEVEPLEAGVLLATGAMEEVRRGISRDHSVELARRAVARGFPDRLERLYLVNAINALLLAGSVDEAVTAVEEGIE